MAESIGSMSSGSGSFKAFIPRCLYLVDDSAPWYYIDGRKGPSEFRHHAPTPALGSSRKRASPVLGPELLEQVADCDLAVVLGQDVFGCRPDGSRRGGAASLEVGESERVVDLDVLDPAQLVGEPLGPLLEVAVAGGDFGGGRRYL